MSRRQRPLSTADARSVSRALKKSVTSLRAAGARRGRTPESIAGRAFSLMLDVKRALTTNMQLHAPMPGFEEGGYTILESSEDAAADILERALKNAEQRGRRRLSPCADKPAIAGMIVARRRTR